MKDPYSILGVNRNSTADEVRAAYIERSRILHPDRFDPQKRKKDWETANRMLAELNAAYSAVMSGSIPDPVPPTAPRQGSAVPHSRPTSATPPPMARTFDLATMPEHIRSRLKERAKGKDGLMLRTESQLSYVVPAFLAYAWFVVIIKLHGVSGLFGTEGGREILALNGVMLFVGFLGTRKIVEWLSTDLLPCVIVAPLYFIRITKKQVVFHPLTTLKQYRMDQSGNRGTVVLQLDAAKETIAAGTQDANRIFEAIERFDNTLRDAIVNGDNAYLRQNDDLVAEGKAG